MTLRASVWRRRKGDCLTVRGRLTDDRFRLGGEAMGEHSYCRINEHIIAGAVCKTLHTSTSEGTPPRSSSACTSTARATASKTLPPSSEACRCLVSNRARTYLTRPRLISDPHRYHVFSIATISVSGRQTSYARRPPTIGFCLPSRKHGQQSRTLFSVKISAEAFASAFLPSQSGREVSE